MSQPGFRALDGVLVRASTLPADLGLPSWPDLDSTEELTSWTRQVWGLSPVCDAVTIASPSLAASLAAFVADPSTVRPDRLRKAAISLMRYLLRWRSRSTPFGLFAGVALANAADAASVRWGRRHLAVRRVDSARIAETITAVEARPDLLRRLTVIINNVGFARGEDWVLDCQPTGDGTVSEVSVRFTAAMEFVVREARAPILFGDLVAKLAAQASSTPVMVIEEMLAELVRRRILLTGLRPPVTATNPHRHLTDQLTRIGATPSPVLDHGETAVRLDCSVSLPPTVIDEAERTATLLARIAPPRPGWAAYHGAFTERYGPGALVPIRDLIDPHRGLGYPAGYRGSAFTDRRPVTSRDLALATHAQEAAMAGRMELVLDEDLLAELETASGSVFPHTELRISIAASDVSAVDRGDFTMTVGCASRHAGTSAGRFLHLLSEADRERITRVYQTLPTATQGGSLMQVASPTLWTRVDGLTRVPPILPILPVGEHLPPHNDSVDLDDLAVTADTQRLTLMSLTTRRPVEPLMLNAVDLKRGVHPLARFLVEISTATSAPCTPFHWGPVAETFAFLPRVRHGRSVLAPARWILSARTLSGPSTPISEWAEAFDIYRRARRVPDLVRLGAEDVLVALNLTDQSHLQLLRRDLAATGTVVVTEDLADDRWIGGRPHEFVVPLASTAPPQPLTRPFRPDRLHRGPGHLPGISPWLHVNLHVRPALQGELLGRLRDLLAGGWDHGPGDWWFIRFPDPAPHLRVRIRLHHADRYGDAARVIGQWAQAAHSKGLLGGIVFDTYRPETGRFGVGRALDAAETVFATDTAVALARLDSPMSAPAATAVGVLDLADGFLGDGGPAWLVSHLAYGGGTRLDRQAIAEVRNPVSLPRELLQRHHKALATYRTLVAPSDIDATMTDLIHLHHARMIGIDSESERTCLRLVRAAVQNVLARRSAS